MLILLQGFELEPAFGEDPKCSRIPTVLKRRAANKILRSSCQDKNLILPSSINPLVQILVLFLRQFQILLKLVCKLYLVLHSSSADLSSYILDKKQPSNGELPFVSHRDSLYLRS